MGQKNPWLNTRLRKITFFDNKKLSERPELATKNYVQYRNSLLLKCWITKTGLKSKWKHREGLLMNKFQILAYFFFTYTKKAWSLKLISQTYPKTYNIQTSEFIAKTKTLKNMPSHWIRKFFSRKKLNMKTRDFKIICHTVDNIQTVHPYI